MHLRSLLRSSLALAALAALIAPSSVEAQTPSRAAADSVFTRARQLVANGNGAAGRVLVDSMVTVATPGTPDYAEALYWRATLAATGSDAEEDYRRIVVEYPLSPKAGDALLQLAQLESARGDRPAAVTHLERFLLETPQHAERSRAGLLLVRLAFDQGDAPRACIALGRTLREVPESSVELRNQLTYFSPRCASVDTTRRVVATTDSAKSRRDTTRRESATAPAAAKGRFTLQVAAYPSRAEADRLVTRLKARKIDARVVGTAKPYRVRVGRYDTRAAATAAASKLKAQKIDAFVTELGGVEK